MFFVLRKLFLQAGTCRENIGGNSSEIHGSRIVGGYNKSKFVLHLDLLFAFFTVCSHFFRRFSICVFTFVFTPVFGYDMFFSPIVAGLRLLRRVVSRVGLARLAHASVARLSMRVLGGQVWEAYPSMFFSGKF